MPQLIQNLACVELSCSTSERRITFSKDILRGKKINSLFLFASSEEVTALNPYRNEAITSIVDFNLAALFLNLFDDKGENFIKNLSFDNFYITPENVNIFNLNIDRVLDMDQCFINIKADVLVNPLKLLLYVVYETEQPSEHLKDEVNGIVAETVPVTAGYQDIKLFDFLGFKLRGKRIDRITQWGTNVFFLDLICTDGRRLENIPMCVLSYYGPNELNFDGLRIDFEQSYFRMRNGIIDGDSILNFIY